MRSNRLLVTHETTRYSRLVPASVTQTKSPCWYTYNSRSNGVQTGVILTEPTHPGYWYLDWVLQKFMLLFHILRAEGSVVLEVDPVLEIGSESPVRIPAKLLDVDILLLEVAKDLISMLFG